MNRFVMFGAIALFMPALAGCGGNGADSVMGRTDAGKHSSPTKLSVLSWSEYFVPDVIAEFENSHFAEVQVTEIDNTEELIQSLAIEPGRYDVVIADDKSLKTLIELQLVGELDQAQLPGMVNISDEFKGLYFDSENRFSVPYLWGTTVIAYREDAFSEVDRSWNLLWNPKVKGRVAMIDEPEDLFFVALLLQKVNPERATEEQIARAADLLTRNFVENGGRMRNYLSALDDLESGELDAVVTYSGDAANRSAKGSGIAFFVPDEGSLRWVDSFAVSRDAPNRKLAIQFIEFMLSPQSAARTANGLHYSSPNSAARPLIDSSLLGNPGLYPDDRLLEKCRFVRFSPESHPLVKQGVQRMIESLRSKGVELDGESSRVLQAETGDSGADHCPIP